MDNGRIICQFSCGAASAVATKLILADYENTRDVQIINAYIEEEHSDNRRFLSDCEKWFERNIIILRDEKYGASAYEVFRRKRFTKGFGGAPCSRQLKRDLLNGWRNPTDVMVLGYTVEEQGRYDRFIDANNVECMVPLIDRGLSKSDCLAMLERAGIEIPYMYRLGYHNANCIGCVKGGEGYWNKIRIDFPEQFEAMAQIESDIGVNGYLFRDRTTNERYSLRELPPDKGRFKDEPEIACSFFCEMADDDINKSIES